MKGYRIHYDLDVFQMSGCMDVPIEDKAEALSKFWERSREKFEGSLDKGDEIDQYLNVTRIEEKDFEMCKACGQPMGNLGLVYDECLNDECFLHHKDQRNK